MKRFSGKTAVWIFAAVFILLSLAGIGAEILRIDIRFAVMVQDMARHGIGVFATVNGVEYADYPSTWILASYLTTLGGSWVTQWSLTLPSVFLGAYIVMMTYLTGERLKPGAGLCAAAFSCLSLEYLGIFLSFGIDVPVAAAGVTMLYLLVSNRRLRYAVPVFMGLLILCFLIRGPLGLVLPGAAVAGYLVAVRQWKALILYGIGGFLATLCCVFFGWFIIRAQGGDELWRTFLEWQIGSRMTTRNYLYFFTNAIVSFALTTLAAAVLLVINWRRGSSRPLIGLIGYIFFPLLLLSIPGCKHLRYMTIALPGFALIAGCCMYAPGKWNVRCRRMCVILNRFALPCAALAVPILLLLGLFILPPEVLPYFHWGSAILLLGAIAMHPQLKKPAIRIGLAGAVLLVLIVKPFIDCMEGAERFVSRVEQLSDGSRVYLYRPSPDHDDLKYVLHASPARRCSIIYLYDELSGLSPVYRRMYPGVELARVIRKIAPGELIVCRDRHLADFQSAAKSAGRKVETVFQGKMGRRTFMALRVE